MLIYKFFSEKYGLEALRQKRFKVSLISELNDPFELMAPNLSNSALRKAFVKFKQEMSRKTGLICFSKMRTNPLLWSHYADRHKGICLGFEVVNEDLHQVIYTSKRPDPEDLFSNNISVQYMAMKNFVATKYSHWQYENEWRLWVGLDDQDPVTGHYYYDFSERAKLKKIVVGPESILSRSNIEERAMQFDYKVECFQARAAFNSFRVVRNQDDSLWK